MRELAAVVSENKNMTSFHVNMTLVICVFVDHKKPKFHLGLIFCGQV